MNDPSPSRRPRRPPRRRRFLRFWLGCAALVVVFGAGLGLGEALHDNPAPGRTQTSIRTLKPLDLPPAERTVTVTR